MRNQNYHISINVSDEYVYPTKIKQRGKIVRQSATLLNGLKMCLLTTPYMVKLSRFVKFTFKNCECYFTGVKVAGVS